MHLTTHSAAPRHTRAPNAPSVHRRPRSASSLATQPPDLKRQLQQLVLGTFDPTLRACYALVLALHEQTAASVLAGPSQNAGLQALMERIGQNRPLQTGAQVWHAVPPALFIRNERNVIELLLAFARVYQPSKNVRRRLEREIGLIRRALRASPDVATTRRLYDNSFDRLGHCLRGHRL